MEPREVVSNWVAAFNRGDADEMASFYSEDPINHQEVQGPMEGRAAIREMFAREFDRATMVCRFQQSNCCMDAYWEIDHE